MKQNTLIGVVIVAIILVAGALYLQGGLNIPNYSYTTSTSSQTPTQSSSMTVATTSATTAASVKSFTIHEHSFGFDVPTITVNKGDTVKITAISDDIGHDICVDGYNVCTSIISSGGSASITFTADKSGTFAYYCNVDGHRAYGMQGTLTVQ